MEAVLFCLGIGFVVAFGLHAGQHWARSTDVAVLLGIAGTIGASAALFCSGVLLAVAFPASFDPRQIGYRTGALLLFGPVAGAVSALAGRRRAAKASRSQASSLAAGIDG